MIETYLEGVTSPATGAVCHYKPEFEIFYAAIDLLARSSSSFSNMPSETLKIHDFEHFLRPRKPHSPNFKRQ